MKAKTNHQLITFGGRQLKVLQHGLLQLCAWLHSQVSENVDFLGFATGCAKIAKLSSNLLIMGLVRCV